MAPVVPRYARQGFRDVCDPKSNTVTAGVAPPAPVKPGLHWHVVTRVDPEAELVVKGHDTHSLRLKLTSRYCPGAHSVHSLSLVLPEGEVRPSPHDVHNEFSDAPL